MTIQVNSLFSSQSIQHVTKRNFNNLHELWIELPADSFLDNKVCMMSNVKFLWQVLPIDMIWIGESNSYSSGRFFSLFSTVLCCYFLHCFTCTCILHQRFSIINRSVVFQSYKWDFILQPRIMYKAPAIFTVSFPCLLQLNLCYLRLSSPWIFGVAPKTSTITFPKFIRNLNKLLMNIT